jgi:hypothetical protein
VIGAGINAAFENVRRGSDALSAAGIAVNGIATSSFRITWLIDRASLDDAVRRLHAAFFSAESIARLKASRSLCHATSLALPVPRSSLALPVPSAIAISR